MKPVKPNDGAEPKRIIGTPRSIWLTSEDLNNTDPVRPMNDGF